MFSDNAASASSASDISGEIESTFVPAITYFSTAICLSVAKDDGVLMNPALIEKLAGIDSNIEPDGTTTFTLEADELGYFLHQLYVESDDHSTISLVPDGIYAFVSNTNEECGPLNFNCQLFTLSEQAK